MSTVDVPADLRMQAITALQDLAGVAEVRRIALLEPSLRADPEFFAALAAHIAETKTASDLVRAVEVTGQSDPDDSSVYVRVEFRVDASPEVAYRFRRGLFERWLRDFEREHDIPLVVTVAQA